MSRKFIALILTVVLVCSMAGVGTMAWYTNQTTSSGNNFTVGTLKLGGVMDGKDVDYNFARLTFDGNLQPGSPPVTMGKTTLKNTGSLPFYLYRITASDLIDTTKGNYIGDKSALNSKLKIIITIGGERVYEGKLGDMNPENGGFFDPIYNIGPGETREMLVKCYIDADAGNELQNLGMSCDFTVYARQNQYPIAGQPSWTYNRDEWKSTGSSTYFYVEPKNEGEYVVFDWDWEPNDWTGNEEYQIWVKHETGTQPGKPSEPEWKKIGYFSSSAKVYTAFDIENNSNVVVDWSKDLIKINRNQFPSDWQGFEVKFVGSQNYTTDEQTLYQYWSLNR